ncbi:MAG: hypothetical protein HY460_02370 [Parcubacteria group bacterium]|nr:hypothetical protein [Parcubacteria group bacterium]
MKRMTLIVVALSVFTGCADLDKNPIVEPVTPRSMSIRRAEYIVDCVVKRLDRERYANLSEKRTKHMEKKCRKAFTRLHPEVKRGGKDVGSL